MAKRNNGRTKLDSIRHKDRRANIPTEELRDFVADEETTPRIMLYPRDASLDPQLVWRGKEDQDGQDLAAPVVPIYIQEKIHPQAIIDALLRREQTEGDQPNLFSDFNDGPKDFTQRIDFYHHEQNWANRLILGDSLLVMASLAEKEGLKGKVQTIYLDPPYGIKFGSNWQVSTRKRDVKDGKAEFATRQPEQVRAFRDTWKLGIHSYLAYLRDRLVVGRDLLTETGSIFVQIGDANVHLVRCLLDEVFGSENFVSLITAKTGSGFVARYLKATSDYVIWYAKNAEQAKFRRLFTDKPTGVETYYDKVQLIDGSLHDATDFEEIPLDATPVALRPLVSAFSQNTNYTYRYKGKDYYCGSARSWKTTPDGMDRLAANNRISASENTLKFVARLDDFPYSEITHVWDDTMELLAKHYVVQTATTIVARCLLMTTDPGDLVLDPTCGSGTTAYVAEQWGRRWITCDTSRVALALARTRMMAAKYPYYLLADSPEGIKKESELTGKMPPSSKTENDIKKGFVCKRVPHVTLKSIANNPGIKQGMTSEEIAAAIAEDADTEILVDQPFEDNKRLRVCGPFSVESLSPHRVLSTADENMDGTVTEKEARNQQDFATMILDNLKKAGVQNTHKGERLTFDRLDPYAAAWLNAAGEYTDNEGKIRRVAVSIGPEHGTVGPQQVKEAAKQAVQGVGFDMLIVCGFAFDPHVAEEVKRYGRLTVLPTKMNPDLAMGDELLKKTGAGNLFMVFGEPDVEIKRDENGQIVAKINGVDVYDPTTGQIRSASTDDIACWFIDTDYNGESFFVRHAYFTGADEPYDKLKRALRAEIDEAVWSSLYSTVSKPFARPESGRVAVKVINHYGDEVLKVLEI